MWHINVRIEEIKKWQNIPTKYLGICSITPRWNKRVIFYPRHFPIFSNSLNIWQSVFEILLTRFSPSEFDSFRTESTLDNVSWSSRGGLSVDVPSEIVTVLSPFCVTNLTSRVTLVRSRSVTHWLVFSESVSRVAVSRVIVTLSHVVSRVVSSVVSPISLIRVDDSVVHFILSSKSFIVDSASVVISRSVSDEFLLSDIDLKVTGQKRSFGFISYNSFHMSHMIFSLIVTWKRYETLNFAYLQY